VSKDEPAPQDEVIHTTIGARQGCPCGAFLFNIIYEFVLKRIREKLIENKLVSTLHYATDAPPWQTYGHGNDTRNAESNAGAFMSDVELVDDAIFLFDGLAP
jgi:hypothetical protein